MVYCHECGSEIAEIDTFCPFCGISIKPVKIGDSDSELEEDLTTSDVKDSNDSSLETTSVDEEKEVEDQDIDMSETIVVKEEPIDEAKDESPVDGGYLDVSTLKDEPEADLEEKTADVVPDDSEEEEFLTTDQIGDEENEAAAEAEDDSTIASSIDEAKEDPTDVQNESSSYLDVSQNQDDIEELLDDDSKSDTEESPNDEDEKVEIVDEVPQIVADEKIIEVESQTVEEVDNEETNDSSGESSDLTEKVDLENDIREEQSEDVIETSDSTSDSEEVELTLEEKVSAEIAEKVNAASIDASLDETTLDEVPPVEATIDETAQGEISESNLFSKDASSEIPSDLQSADESEIDDALSVIDSKALAWKKNSDGTTTPTTAEDTEESEPTNEPLVVESKEEEKPAAEIEEEIVEVKEDSDAPSDEPTAATVSTEIESDEIIDEKKPSEEQPSPTSDVSSKDESSEIVESSSSQDTIPVVPNEFASNEAEVEPEVVKEQTIEDETEVTDSTSEESSEDGTEVTDSTSEESSEDEREVTDSTSEESSEDGTEVTDSTSEESSEDVPTPTTPNMDVVDTDGNKSTKLKPIDEGVVLNNRYEIVRKIGGGGMGAVYLANDKNLGGVLRAVKEMVQSYIEEEQQEKALNDFKRESMLLTSLEHPSIPTIYDYFYDQKEGRFYLVMKYISGGDLAARLRAAPEGRIDEISVTDWAYQIADVLEYLHTRNPCIVYRDLKPANIMIDGNSNKVMLIDFGIARSINKEEKGVTAVGTMGYAPPELFSGNVQPASDIYSLGSTMFHLLTGADPQSNPLLIFDFQKHPRPRQINPQLSDQMERILMRAVEYNAEKRFHSAAEMRNALKDHLDNLKAGNISFGIKETPTAVALSDQPVFCGFCGQKIVATDMFCAFCGAKQPLAQPGVHSQEYHIPQVTAKLVIEGTSDLDYPAFELVKSDNLLGRRDPMSNIFPEIDLSKFDPQTKISRKHARIWRDGENFMLEDLGSSNGTTWISSQGNARLAPNQTQVLQNGDKIQVGDTTLQFISG